MLRQIKRPTMGNAFEFLMLFAEREQILNISASLAVVGQFLLPLFTRLELL